MNENARLAASGTRNDERRLGGRSNRPALRVVQVFEDGLVLLVLITFLVVYNKKLHVFSLAELGHDVEAARGTDPSPAYSSHHQTIKLKVFAAI